MASTNGGGSSFLVTGALGFVGRHVVEEILAAGHRVVCLCRPSSQGSATADGMVGELAGEFSQPVGRVECDLSDPADVARAVDLAECGTVIHLAALYSWWAPDPAVYQLHNVHVVANLVGAVKEASSKTRRRIKLVQVSTVLAYGRPTGRGLTPETAFEEEDEPGPCLSMYAGSKAEGDRLALASMHSGEIDGCVVYLACCLGRDPKLLDPKRDVMRIKDLVDGKIPATITSQAVFTYVYVGDAATAIVRAARKADNVGERYLIGDQRLVTAEYYNLVAEISGTPRPRFEVPAWLALSSGVVTSWWSRRVSGATPTAPADLVRTAVGGNFLFSAAKSKSELGMTYTPVRVALEEAIEYIRAHEAQSVSG